MPKGRQSSVSFGLVALNNASDPIGGGFDGKARRHPYSHVEMWASAEPTTNPSSVLGHQRGSSRPWRGVPHREEMSAFWGVGTDFVVWKLPAKATKVS